MKKTLAVLFCLLLAVCAFAQGNSEPAAAPAAAPAATAKPAAQKYHIGIVTGTVSQSEDDLRGAEALIKEYGAVKDGGMIQHVTYPDNFMSTTPSTQVRLPVSGMLMTHQLFVGQRAVTANLVKTAKAAR